MRRCTHPEWRTVGAHFDPPPTREIDVKSQNGDLMLTLAYGLTTITERCAVCGRLNVQTVPGRISVKVEDYP